MKHTMLFLAALLGLSSFSGEAKADRVDFTTSGTMLDMGTVAVGQYGLIGTATDGDRYDRVFNGILTPNAYIIFSYQLTSPLTGTYSYGVDPTTSEPGLFTIEKAYDSSANMFKVLISNLQDQIMSFSSFIRLNNYNGDVVTSYTTVPLPAALPLFGLGLIGLAGYKRMKKGNKTA